MIHQWSHYQAVTPPAMVSILCASVFSHKYHMILFFTIVSTLLHILCCHRNLVTPGPLLYRLCATRALCVLCDFFTGGGAVSQIAVESEALNEVV